MGEERKNKGIFIIGVNICNILIYNNIYIYIYTHTHSFYGMCAVISVVSDFL